MLNRINEWYPNYSHVLDKDFLRKLDKSPKYISTKYTEILTAKILAENNSDFHLSSPSRKNKASPDFLLHRGEEKIFIECTTPQNQFSSDENRIEDKTNGGVHTPDIQKIQLMIINALHEKMIGAPKKEARYKAYLSTGIIEKTDPFIIVIGLYGEIPFSDLISYYNKIGFNLIPHHIIGTFFPFGPPAIRFSIDPREEVDDTLYLTLQDAIQKHNDSLIRKDIFLDKRFASLSAVIISGKNASPDHDVFNDFIMIHNPNAKNKIPFNTINVKEEYAFINNTVISVKDWIRNPYNCEQDKLQQTLLDCY